MSSKASSKPQTKSATTQTQQSKSKKQRRRRPRRGRRNRFGGLSRVPASIGFSGRGSTRIVNMRGGKCQLVVREMFPVSYKASTAVLDFMMPCTPTMWTNTRSAQLAATYMSFRPLNVNMRWMSNTGTAAPGSASFGTVWAGTHLNFSTRSEASRILTTTNGGFLTSIWKPQSCNIACQGNLQQHNFPLNDIQPDDVPFWFVGTFDGVDASADQVLGYLVVDALFSLFNPTSGINEVHSSASSIWGAMVHSDATESTPALTTLGIKCAQAIIGDFKVGDDYLFYAANPLLNTAGEVAVKPMEAIHAVFKEKTTVSDEPTYIFTIDSSLASQAVVWLSLIGKIANFLLPTLVSTGT